MDDTFYVLLFLKDLLHYTGVSPVWRGLILGFENRDDELCDGKAGNSQETLRIDAEWQWLQVA